MNFEQQQQAGLRSALSTPRNAAWRHYIEYTRISMTLNAKFKSFENFLH